MISAIFQVLRVALPLMISTGLFSITLFVDRTLLLWHDGTSMSASMAAGNLFWVLICLPVGIASMTGAIVSQYVGSGQSGNVGRFLWQSVWVSLAFLPWFGAIAFYAPDLFRSTGQEDALIDAETIYLRLLMFGAVGNVIETALSGFFSGTERTGAILWASIAATAFNLLADVALIFGIDAIGIPPMGIAGAAIASSLSFWLKAIIYGVLLLSHKDWIDRYQTRKGFGIDFPMIRKLIFFGLPAGLMFVAESGAFTAIVLRIGTLGDLPLRATTMAINFNMIAFIPLVGVSIAASVLVGRNLTESGPQVATNMAKASLIIGWVYSGLWAITYLVAGDAMLSIYRLGDSDPLVEPAIAVASGLLIYVAMYIVADATQLVMAGVLRGAGDTWYVLLACLIAGTIGLAIGWWGEAPPIQGDIEQASESLQWWWQVILMWIWILSGLMAIRFATGRWKTMRMVDREDA